MSFGSPPKSSSTGAGAIPRAGGFSFGGGASSSAGVTGSGLGAGNSSQQKKRAAGLGLGFGQLGSGAGGSSGFGPRAGGVAAVGGTAGSLGGGRAGAGSNTNASLSFGSRPPGAAATSPSPSAPNIGTAGMPGLGLGGGAGLGGLGLRGSGTGVLGNSSGGGATTRTAAAAPNVNEKAGGGMVTSFDGGGLSFVSPSAAASPVRSAFSPSVGSLVASGPPPSTPPSPSVGLSCSGPDGRSVHSVVWSPSQAGYDLETRFLPLGCNSDGGGDVGTDEDASTSANAPRVVRTSLPYHARKSLEADPPLGLICVDRDDGSSSLSVGGRSGGEGVVDVNALRVRPLPLLCLYSRHALYVIRVGYTFQGITPASAQYSASTTAEGRILSLVEPLETYLLSLPGATIRCVRPAPQSWHPPAGCGGKGALHRPGAFAALVDECGGTEVGGVIVDGGGEQALVLCHGFAADSENGDNDGNGDEARMNVTVPVRHGYEYLGPTQSDPIVDFCFFRAPPSASTSTTSTSTNLSVNGLFPSFAVLLLTRRGNLHAASPVVFDGSVHPRRCIADAASYLDGEVQRLDRDLNNRTDDPRWRRCKAARKFLGDAFGDMFGSGGSGGYYATARVAAARNGASDGSPTEPTEDATTWPVSVQGPLISLSDGGDDDYYQVEGSHDYVALDNFLGCRGAAGGSPLGGIVAARRSKVSVGGAGADSDVDAHGNPTATTTTSTISLNFAVLPSGPSLLPRFAFESPEDADALDLALEGLAAVVERVDLLDDVGHMHDDDGGTGRAAFLLPDASDPTQLHVVSPRGVVTVRTTAVDVAAENVVRTTDAEPEATTNTASGSSALVPMPVPLPVQEEPKTRAWSCVEIATVASRAGGASLTGAAVSSDATVGRVLIARLSDGCLEAVDLTAAQYLHEASILAAEREENDSAALVSTQSGSAASLESDRALRAMESLTPLHELITPLLCRVTSGLAGMGKIVGAATEPSSVDAAGLASVLETKTRCERDVILPLAELREATSARTRILAAHLASQREQLDALRETASELRNRLQESADRCSAAKEGGEELAGRSAAVLGAARDLAPALTVAEKEYAAQLRRYDAQISKWEGGVDQLREEAAAACDVMQTNEHLKGPASPGAGAARETSRSAPSGTCRVRLGAEQVGLCRNLLRGQEVKLKRGRGGVREMERTVQDLAKVTGIDEGISPVSADANKENGPMQ